jgi:hypothetical protein
MNVGFHRRGVEPQLVAIDQLALDSVLRQTTVDSFPRIVVNRILQLAQLRIPAHRDQ